MLKIISEITGIEIPQMTIASHGVINLVAKGGVTAEAKITKHKGTKDIVSGVAPLTGTEAAELNKKGVPTVEKDGQHFVDANSFKPAVNAMRKQAAITRKEMLGDRARRKEANRIAQSERMKARNKHKRDERANKDKLYGAFTDRNLVKVDEMPSPKAAAKSLRAKPSAESRRVGKTQKATNSRLGLSGKSAKEVVSNAAGEMPSPNAAKQAASAVKSVVSEAILKDPKKAVKYLIDSKAYPNEKGIQLMADRHGRTPQEMVIGRKITALENEARKQREIAENAVPLGVSQRGNKEEMANAKAVRSKARMRERKMYTQIDKLKDQQKEIKEGKLAAKDAMAKASETPNPSPNLAKNEAFRKQRELKAAVDRSEVALKRANEKLANPPNSKSAQQAVEKAKAKNTKALEQLKQFNNG